MGEQCETEPSSILLGWTALNDYSLVRLLRLENSSRQPRRISSAAQIGITHVPWYLGNGWRTGSYEGLHWKSRLFPH